MDFLQNTAYSNHGFKNRALIVYSTILIWLRALACIFFIFPGSFFLLLPISAARVLYWRLFISVVLPRQIEYRNLDRLPKDKGYILLANHLHAVDWMMFGMIGEQYAIAKHDLFGTEFGALNFLTRILFYNFMLISYVRGDPNSGLKVKERVQVLTLNHKRNVLVFPEGTSSLNTKNGVLPFKLGIFALAFESNIPLVVAVIHYTDPEYGLPKSKVFNPLETLRSTSSAIVSIVGTLQACDYKTSEEMMADAHRRMSNELELINLE